MLSGLRNSSWRSSPGVIGESQCITWLLRHAALRLGQKHQVHSLHRDQRGAAQQRCDSSSSEGPFAASNAAFADQVVELGAAAM